MAIWIIFVLSLTQSAWGQISFFSGGAMSFRFTDTSSSLYEVELTTVTSWQLGEGPCGKACSVADIGTSSTTSRGSIIAGAGSGVLGFWSREKNFVQSDITTVVESSIQGTVTAVNVAMDYEEEVARVVLTVDPSADYIDVSFHGNNWRSFDYEYKGLTSYHLQVKIDPGRRNDTGQPNNSPVAISQPLYSIQLNKKSTIKLAATDSDGDEVRCSLGKFISAGGLTVPPKVYVNEDCTIDIEPLASDGYFVDGVGTVPIVITDYNREVITIEGDASYREPGDSPLSYAFLQFMFKTVADVSGPEFVFPSYDSQHVFEIYQGCYFRVPLRAKQSSPGSDIAFVTRSAPYLPLSTGPILKLTGGMKHVDILSPRQLPVGAYAIGAIAFDSKGSSDRNYKLHVKPRNPMRKISKPERSKTPYMAYVPLSAYVCHMDSSCTFPVFTENGSVISVQSSTFSNVELGKTDSEFIEHEAVQVTDITVTSGVLGANTVCINIQEKLTEDRIACIDIFVEDSGICRSGPCNNGGSCVTVMGRKTFTCVCADGFEGKTCDKKVELKVPEPKISKAKDCHCVCNNSSGADFNTREYNSTMMSPEMASGVSMGTAIATPIGVVLGGGALTFLKKCVSKVTPQEVIDEVKEKLPEVPDDEEDNEEDEKNEEEKRKEAEENKWRERFHTSMKRPCTQNQSLEMMGLPDSDILFV